MKESIRPRDRYEMIRGFLYDKIFGQSSFDKGITSDPAIDLFDRELSRRVSPVVGFKLPLQSPNSVALIIAKHYNENDRFYLQNNAGLSFNKLCQKFILDSVDVAAKEAIANFETMQNYKFRKYGPRRVISYPQTVPTKTDITSFTHGIDEVDIIYQ